MSKIKPKIDLNSRFQETLDLMENTRDNIFLTGKAGTGKSTLLQYFRTTTAKKIVVVAPTGVAALNVSGQTIHSFFRFAPGISPEDIKFEKKSKKLTQILKKLDMIIIDEISMVRADLLDCIDESLRYYLLNNKPFGGIQMVFIGDLFQLPPIVVGEEEMRKFRTQYPSPYFFSANVMQQIDIKIIELETIYRQSDQIFIDLLNKIRTNRADSDDISLLNSRCQVDYFEPEDMYITLTTTNIAADDINKYKLAQLTTKSYLLAGELAGDFSTKQLPTQVDLEVKIGSQIMLLNNDAADRWVNGSMGRIIDITNNQFDDDIVLVVKLDNGETVEVDRYTWRATSYFYNPDTKIMDSETVGSFTQYPIRLAWAVTIHKSQGKTFNHVVLDIGRGAFAHGQTYVAISRVTSLQGLLLRRPISPRDISIDTQVVEFMAKK